MLHVDILRGKGKEIDPRRMKSNVPVIINHRFSRFETELDLRAPLLFREGEKK